MFGAKAKKSGIFEGFWGFLGFLEGKNGDFKGFFLGFNFGVFGENVDFFVVLTPNFWDKF